MTTSATDDLSGHGGVGEADPAGTGQRCDWLDARPGMPWVSSALIEVELPRALRRTEPALLADVPATVARVARYDIDPVVRAAAAAYPDPDLRSLDAIHLATARSIFGHRLAAFVTYDRRLLAAAAASGLPVESPGAP